MMMMGFTMSYHIIRIFYILLIITNVTVTLVSLKFRKHRPRIALLVQPMVHVGVLITFVLFLSHNLRTPC